MPTIKTTICCFAVLAAFAARPPAAAAQVTSATLVGTVSDQSGGGLPGVAVTARNADTGLTRTVVTGDSGAYRLEFLPIGSYQVEAALSGFKTEVRSGIVLAVNDAVR